jgi:hypothetical protein
LQHNPSSLVGQLRTGRYRVQRFGNDARQVALIEGLTQFRQRGRVCGQLRVARGDRHWERGPTSANLLRELEPVMRGIARSVKTRSTRCPCRISGARRRKRLQELCPSNARALVPLAGRFLGDGDRAAGNWKSNTSVRKCLRCARGFVDQTRLSKTTSPTCSPQARRGVSVGTPGWTAPCAFSIGIRKIWLFKNPG